MNKQKQNEKGLEEKLLSAESGEEVIEKVSNKRGESDTDVLADMLAVALMKGLNIGRLSWAHEYKSVENDELLTTLNGESVEWESIYQTVKTDEGRIAAVAVETPEGIGKVIVDTAEYKVYDTDESNPEAEHEWERYDEWEWVGER